MIINLVFVAILALSALFIILSKDYVTSIVLLNIFSLSMTAMYVVMNAPDVAITEASIGACITTIFFLWTLMIVQDKSNGELVEVKIKFSLINNVCIFFVIFVFATMMFYAFGDLPKYGIEDAPLHNEIYKFYVEGTKNYFGFPNMVAAILAGFRGYDTLGETVVIFTGGVAVNLLLKD